MSPTPRIGSFRQAIIDRGVTLAFVIDTKTHGDDRGGVTETYRESWFPMVPPVKQLVQSVSRANVLRGMHLHRKQWDIWRFVAGEARVRLYDHTTGAQAIIDGAGKVIAIPPGISHGFYTAEGCTLVYALTNEYDGTDEYGWFYRDGDPVGWTAGKVPMISGRDASAPRLADFDAASIA